MNKSNLIELSKICQETGTFSINEDFANLDRFQAELIIKFYNTYTDKNKTGLIKKIIEILKKWDKHVEERGNINEERTTYSNVILYMINRIPDAKSDAREVLDESDKAKTIDSPLIVYEVLKYIELLIDNNEKLNKEELLKMISKDRLSQVNKIIAMYNQKRPQVAKLLNAVEDPSVLDELYAFCNDENYKNSDELSEIIDAILHRVSLISWNQETTNYFNSVNEIIKKIRNNKKLTLEQKLRLIKAISPIIKSYSALDILSSFINKVFEWIESNPNDIDKYVVFIEKTLSYMDLNEIDSSFTANQNGDTYFQPYMISSFTNVSDKLKFTVLREFQLKYLQENRPSPKDEAQAEAHFNDVAKALEQTKSEMQANLITNIALSKPELPEKILKDIAVIISKSDPKDIGFYTSLENIILLLADELLDETNESIYQSILDLIKNSFEIGEQELKVEKIGAIESICKNSNLSLDDLLILVQKISGTEKIETVYQITDLASNDDMFVENGLNTAINYVMQNNSPVPYEEFMKLLSNQSGIKIITPDDEISACVSSHEVRAYDLYNYASSAEMGELLQEKEYTDTSMVELRYTIQNNRQRTKKRLRERKKCLAA